MRPVLVSLQICLDFKFFEASGAGFGRLEEPAVQPGAAQSEPLHVAARYLAYVGRLQNEPASLSGACALYVVVKGTGLKLFFSDKG